MRTKVLSAISVQLSWVTMWISIRCSRHRCHLRVSAVSNCEMRSSQVGVELLEPTDRTILGLVQLVGVRGLRDGLKDRRFDLVEPEVTALQILLQSLMKTGLLRVVMWHVAMRSW